MPKKSQVVKICEKMIRELSSGIYLDAKTGEWRVEFATESDFAQAERLEMIIHLMLLPSKKPNRKKYKRIL